MIKQNLCVCAILSAAASLAACNAEDVGDVDDFEDADLEAAEDFDEADEFVPSILLDDEDWPEPSILPETEFDLRNDGGAATPAPGVTYFQIWVVGSPDEGDEWVADSQFSTIGNHGGWHRRYDLAAGRHHEPIR